jgi:hypothetical protein
MKALLIVLAALISIQSEKNSGLTNMGVDGKWTGPVAQHRRECREGPRQDLLGKKSD